jgi:hypothetical protein
MANEPRNPAFPRMIAKFCRKRAAAFLPPREVELLAGYMIGLFDHGTSPPNRGRGLHWTAIAADAGVDPVNLLAAASALRPGFEALRRELRKPTGRPRGRPRKSPASCRPTPSATLSPRTRTPGPSLERSAPIAAEWMEPVDFATALDLHMRRHRDTPSGLVHVLAAEGWNIPYSTLRMWRLGLKTPSHKSSLDILAVLARRWQLPEDYFARKLLWESGALHGHDLPDMTASERRRLAWHLPHDFNHRPRAEQEEILSWIKT